MFVLFCVVLCIKYEINGKVHLKNPNLTRKMKDFEVEVILDKRTTGRKEKKVEYLLKWKGYKRPSWAAKADLNCNRLIVEYERKIGPGKIFGKYFNITYL